MIGGMGDPIPSILHADLDAFYASVEQLLDPQLRGRPIAVGGSVVLAASYEAKRFGVSGGMAGWQAKQRCPELLFVRGNFREYQRLGDAVYRLLCDYTPAIERISIDEAFLDVGGSRRLFGAPDVIARTIRTRVREEIGLPISVGAARTKHLAKIASQVAKPDGLVIVDPAAERAFLDPLPVGLVWGVGPATKERLARRGIATIGQLADAGRAKSVGAQSALGRVEHTPDLLAEVLGHLADRVAMRLRAKGRTGRSVTVRIRFPGMRAITRSVTLDDPIATTLTLREVADRLVTGALREMPHEREITLLAISVGHLVQQETLQLELAVGDDDPTRMATQSGAARLAVDQSMDAVRERFGTAAVGYGAVVLGKQRLVPDEFRELAERDR
jgi:DNA polymerase-4